MKNWFDRLNLRPQERRLVVVVGLVVFILLNMWFIWPYFGQWSEVSARMRRSRDTLGQYQAEIARRPEFEKKRTELESTGSQMLSNELELQRLVQSQAAATGLQIVSTDPRQRMSGGKTNQFFQEQSLSIQFTSGGKELVDFLVGIAAGNQMVRVREMNVKPDPQGFKLVGNIVFVGNYQGRPPTNVPARNPTKAAPSTSTKSPTKTSTNNSSKVPPRKQT